MSLAPGTRLGAYEISSLLGEGGMGQVYRAHDARLGRDVAIKVLPDALVADPDRAARFEREAKTLAALNDPHIAHVYGFEHADGIHALVMELVEGPTLADRIAQGPIPIDEAIAIAKQVALALEAAHEQGIVHRDLKPANIKVRPDGTVKLLDFGLAKALEQGGTGGMGGTGGKGLSMSPTLSVHATQAGFLLGTAAYMAPEQARGAPVDKRADVWAFGVVLYEMLTGRRLFAGDTISDTLAAVLRESLAFDALPPPTPPAVRRVLRRCLERDPKRRLRDIGDARLELDQNVADDSSVAPTPARPRGLALALVATAIVAIGAVVAVVVLAARRPPAAPPQYRFAIPVPRELSFNPGGGPGFAVSPDGRWVIYASLKGIVRHALDQLDSEVVRGTDGDTAGRAPFVSPDSQWIGFGAGGLLKKVPITGGIATTIGEIPGPSRGTWGDDGTIVFASNGRLYRIPSSGGKADAIPDKKSGGWSDPVFLPGSAIVLAVSGSPNQSTGQIFAVRMATGEAVAITDGSSPRFVAPDRIVFEQRGALWTARLDPGWLALRGAPAPLAEHVRLVGRFAFASASPTVLAYVPGIVLDPTNVVWIDRKGQTTPAMAEAGSFQHPRLSPDGRSVAVSVQSVAGADLWVYDLDRGTRLRLTSSGGNRRPIWSPDGKRIAFQNGSLVFAMAADGSGTATPLINRTVTQFPDSWSADGRLLLFNEGSQARDIWAHAMDGRDKPDTPLVATRFSERSAMISPDGKWLAFVSDESGRDEVYVQPMAGGPKVAVSTAGGWQPLWSRNGRELFFRADDVLMASDMSAPARPGAPVRLFEFSRALYGQDSNVVEYDVAADGRFLAVRRTAQTVDEIHVLTDWIR